MVYVDDYPGRVGGMRMTRMAAKSEAELDRMAVAVGLHIVWKHRCQRTVYYNLSKAKHNKAVDLGAVPITAAEMRRKFFSGEENMKLATELQYARQALAKQSESGETIQ